MTSTVVACSLVEAQRRLGEKPLGGPASAPALARRLRESDACAVCIVVDTVGGRSLVWIDTEHAQGWLSPLSTTALPCSGTSDRFASHLGAAMAKGFVVADAAVLATMATTRDGRKADPAAEESRATDAGADFVHDPALLPQLSWGEEALFSAEQSAPSRRLDLYAIVDSAERVLQVLAAGVKTVQLRIKKPEKPNAGWDNNLRVEVERGLVACDAAGAELFINDHWQVAAQAGARGVHLGQEDLLSLGDSGRAAVQASGMAIGISSHSLWELCRARTLRPRYIACGPVWPTLTKAMPWRAQGLDNLSWWCRIAGCPVVAIGGVLGAGQVLEAASAGADGICIVRGLGDQPECVVPALQGALREGRAASAGASSLGQVWPHPSLSPAPR